MTRWLAVGMWAVAAWIALALCVPLWGCGITPGGEQSASPTITEMQDWLQTQEINALDPRIVGAAMSTGAGLLLLGLFLDAPKTQNHLWLKPTALMIAVGLIACGPMLLLLVS